ncbi:hypothetical protein [Methylobacterium sp. Leaf123]|uniref:hypothetical protein n=1 Tax=Methylobacterium sp. Leaf123 TaxID=1736264 RepID=UPI000AF1517E|nr:hypothetical protein [Methylobacterium sp. Leaf123]
MSKAIENERRRCAVMAASARSIGPVTAALRAMQSDTPEIREIQALRAAIADRIERDIELLDRLDAGEFRS